jgi:hypothetical protein
MYFSYIGDIDDPEFRWDKPEDAPSGGNLPRRVVPERFGSLGVGLPFMERMIREQRYDARKLDWGAWGLKMTGAELRALLIDADTKPEVFAALDPEKSYVLIVAEDI